MAVLVTTYLSAALVAEPPARVEVAGGRILDVASGRYREVGAIVVEGDRIAAIEAALPGGPEANVTRVEAAGRTIVPGLVDLAAAALPSADLDVDFHYALSLAHGVTAMRVVDAVLPWSVTQRDRARKGDTLAPRLWTSGPVLGAREPTGPWALLEREPRRAFVAIDASTASREASRQAEARVDWVRLRADVPPDAVRAAVAALTRRGVSVSAAPGATSMAQLAALGVDVIDGLAAPLRPTEGPVSPRTAFGSGDDEAVLDAAWRGMGASETTALARRIAEARVCVVPMLRVAIERVRASRDADLEAELALLPERARAVRRETITRSARDAGAPPSGAIRAWEAQRRLVAALAAAGTPIGVASGASQDGWPVPGLAVHRELALLVAAGLSPAQAIRAATVGGAAALDAARLLGPVRIGAAADFFVVEGDPLADIGALRRITHVVRGGEVLDPKALLAQAKRASARAR
jgi:hypothetical protein